MPSVRFSARLVFDRHFVNDVKEKRITSSPLIFHQLMKINDRAKGLSRTHNVMSKKVFGSILDENPNMPRIVLKAAFFPIEEEAFEDIPDEVERNIKIAIDLLEEEPHRTIIMTSEDMVPTYTGNPHFIGVKEIDVKAGSEAVAILEAFFSACAGSDR